MTKYSFPGLFRQAYTAAMTESNLQNGFRSCGIYPYNPQCLPEHALSPAIPPDIPIQQSAAVEEAVASTSYDDLPTASPPSAATQQKDGLSPLELLANTSLLVQEQENLDLQEISLDDPAQLLELINQGVVDIIPSPSLDELSENITTKAASNISDSGIVTPGASKSTENMHAFASTSEISAISTSCERTPCADISDNSLTSPKPFSILETTADWNVEIKNVFLPKTPSPSEKQEKKKTKITHHRLLTSCEVIREKREAAEKKTKKENEKLERLKKRQEKNQQNCGRIVVLK